MTLDYQTSESEGKAALPDLSGRTIVQLIPEMQAGGAERGTVEVARGIVEAGGRALVVSAPGGRLLGDLSRVGGEHIPLDIGKKSIFALRGNVKKLAAIVTAEKADLIHARSRMPAWVARGTAQKTGIPYLATWHGLHQGGSLKKRYNRPLVDGERVIAISNFIADHIEKTYGIGADKLRLIPRGVDLSQFMPESVLGGRLIALSEQWKVPDGVPVVLMPGRLTEWKGQKLLIEAAAKLRDKIGDWKFVVVILGDDQGRADYTKSLEKMIESLDLWNVMRLAPHCNDMGAAYKLSDIVVVPSLKPEPFGRVPIEAQAMGAMVVAADHGGLAETVIEGETGFLFPPGDAAALAGVLEKALVIDDAEREARAKRASDRVRTDYDGRLMVSRTLEVYREILTQKRAVA